MKPVTALPSPGAKTNRQSVCRHAKTLKLEKIVWHNVPPFPVVYDESSRMTTAWGVHELPTSALIDPHGNLVRDGDLAVLRAKVDGK